MVLARRTLSLTAVALLCCTPAFAERATTRDALERLEEVLESRLDDGTLRKAQLLPTLVVSTRARYEESQGWFPAEALSALIAALGTEDLRSCEACMQPRVYSEEGRLEYSSGAIGLDEIIRLDANARGKAEPARSAIWLDEHAAGVAIRIVDLSTGRILFAENIDPTFREVRESAKLMRKSEEFERRARGEGLTHAFVDIVMYPSPQLSMDWTDQWGESNENFTGVSLSLFDPVLGLGLGYYRVIDVFHIASYPVAPQLGFKMLMSLPTALVQSVAMDDTNDVIDALLTGTVVVRVPIGRSNYALIANASINMSSSDEGLNPRVGIGISLLNISLLPVLP